LYSYDDMGLVAINKAADSSFETVYSICDGLGNVEALVNMQGKKVADYAGYGEWGSELWVGGDNDNPFRFTGRLGSYTDDTLRRVLNWFRWYDEDTMTWITKDPAGILGGNNLYQYVKNNPISVTDPFGLCAPHPQPTPNPTPEPKTCEQQFRDDISDCRSKYKEAVKRCREYTLYGMATCLAGATQKYTDCVYYANAAHVGCQP
jgi:RHS repeat-associated protein